MESKRYTKRGMTMNAYEPVKVGTGNKVHAARVTGTVQKGFFAAPTKTYRTLCTIVNSHNINAHPSYRTIPMPSGTAITCEHCLAKIAREAQG